MNAYTDNDPDDDKETKVHKTRHFVCVSVWMTQSIGNASVHISSGVINRAGKKETTSSAFFVGLGSIEKFNGTKSKIQIWQCWRTPPWCQQEIFYRKLINRLVGYFEFIAISLLYACYAAFIAKLSIRNHDCAIVVFSSSWWRWTVVSLWLVDTRQCTTVGQFATVNERVIIAEAFSTDISICSIFHLFWISSSSLFSGRANRIGNIIWKPYI